MNDFTEDQLVETARAFVDREVYPVASALEQADEYPAQLIEQMRVLGFFGAKIKPEHGGLGLSTRAYARIVEELSRGWMSLTGAVNTHTVVAYLIDRFGTAEQAERLLPAMATGVPRAALSLSESDAGSDLNAIRCRARRDDDRFVINGTKMWVTNGERAGIVALLGRTDDAITCFIIEKDPGPRHGGISVSRHVEKLGYRGLETVEMVYEDHAVPASAVLGGEEGLGRGMAQVLAGLELGRINIAARAVGLARAAFDAALRYAQERETFGRPIAEHQAIQFKLADMATRISAARALTLAVAEQFDTGVRSDVEAGMAKLFASEVALEAAVESMRIHGGYGYTTEFPVERYLRDAPLMLVGEGTNEIQRLVIAQGLLRRTARGEDALLPT